MVFMKHELLALDVKKGVYPQNRNTELTLARRDLTSQTSGPRNLARLLY